MEKWRANTANWLDRAFEMPVGQIVALGRLAMASFALAAIYIDPAQPTRSGDATYTLLIVYLAFALIVFAGSRRKDLTQAALVTIQAVDIFVFSILIFLTEGSTSPFFVFFTFTILAATLQWGSWGTIAIALLLVTLLIVVSMVYAWLAPLGGEDFELNRLILRSTYLLVSGGMLACVAGLRERTVRRLEALATWPAETANGDQALFLQASLQHAASILRARRVLVLWQDTEEPSVEAFYWDGAKQAKRTFPRAELEDLLSCPGRRQVFAMADASSDGEPPDAGALQGGRVRIRRDVAEEFKLSSLIGAPIEAPGFIGWVVFVDTDLHSADVLSLAKITAVRVAGEIEHFRLRQQRELEAASRERSRIGRDIHDSLLQSLAAAGLRMKVLEAKLPEALRGQFARVRSDLTELQQRLRGFVTETRSIEIGKPLFRLLEEGKPVSLKTARQWGCALSYSASPEDLSVPALLGSEINLIVDEAIANAVRHGKASSIAVAISLEATALRLAIKDDGVGYRDSASPSGDLEEVERKPRSIDERVRQLGGAMTVTSSAKGVAIEIVLPLP